MFFIMGDPFRSSTDFEVADFRLLYIVTDLTISVNRFAGPVTEKFVTVQAAPSAKPKLPFYAILPDKISAVPPKQPH